MKDLQYPFIIDKMHGFMHPQQLEVYSVHIKTR